MENAGDKIIVCNDEAALRKMLSDHLTECGYSVQQAVNGPELVRLLQPDDTDLIILDVRRPGLDGLTTLQEIRATSETPIMMLISDGEFINEVFAHDFKVDDYLVTPADLRELQVRVNSIIHRDELSISQEIERIGQSQLIPFGPCKLDVFAAQLFAPDGNEIAISAMEFRLLKVFIENKGRVLSRSQLLEYAHDQGSKVYDRSIDLRISRLRRKIEPNPSKPEIIRTIHGLGYIFD